MSESAETKRVLLVDDDPKFIASLRDALHDIVELHVVSKAAEAVTVSERWQPDLVILDVLLTQGDAFQLLDQIRAVRDDEPYGVVYLSKGPGAHTQYQPFGNELFGILDRDLNVIQLRAEVRRALDFTTNARPSAA
jgi:PleD family two-component response regulator